MLKGRRANYACGWRDDVWSPATVLWPPTRYDWERVGSCPLQTLARGDLLGDAVWHRHFRTSHNTPLFIHRVTLYFFALRSLVTSHDIPQNGKISRRHDATYYSHSFSEWLTLFFWFLTSLTYRNDLLLDLLKYLFSLRCCDLAFAHVFHYRWWKVWAELHQSWTCFWTSVTWVILHKYGGKSKYILYSVSMIRHIGIHKYRQKWEKSLTGE